MDVTCMLIFVLFGVSFIFVTANKIYKIFYINIAYLELEGNYSAPNHSLKILYPCTMRSLIVDEVMKIREKSLEPIFL